MMKRILIFICLLATIGSTFAVDCKSNEHCCLRTRFHPGCRRCCSDRDDPDWTKSVDCKADEHCCVNNAAGGCAECCPNKLDIPMSWNWDRDDMNEVNEAKERDDPDWTKPVNCRPS